MAAKTSEAATLDDQLGERAEALEMTDTPPVSALAVKMVISTARAGPRPPG